MAWDVYYLAFLILRGFFGYSIASYLRVNFDASRRAIDVAVVEFVVKEMT